MHAYENKHLFRGVYNGVIGVFVFDKHGTQFYQEGSEELVRFAEKLPDDLKGYCLSVTPEYYYSIAGHNSIFIGKRHSYMGDEYTGKLTELEFPRDAVDKLAEEYLALVPPALYVDKPDLSDIEKALRVAILLV